MEQQLNNLRVEVYGADGSVLQTVPFNDRRVAIAYAVKQRESGMIATVVGVDEEGGTRVVSEN